MGFYYEQMKRYFGTFDKSQIRVYLYEDFTTNPMSIVQNTFQFLGVDDTFAPDVSIKHNVSGIPKNKGLHTFLRKEHDPIKFILKPLIPKELRRRIMLSLHNRNLDKPPLLAPELRRQLIEVYREDILKLQNLIQRDLSTWLK